MTESERGGGAVSVPMAIAMLAMILMIGLALDGVRAAQGLARADAVAEEAARAAGQALDPAALFRGVAVVDPVAAQTAAQTYIAAAGASGVATITASGRIHVEVVLTRPTLILGLIGRDQLQSHGSADAVLVPVLPVGGAP
ncbi:pilus assembly protein TadG-related protein [Pseudonocardia sp. GCM10023141]|uniref:pilus assembly protein TadG-related protein n=1 Tax=Pseudonocardia sp. GCM10023141 TaxID=3252653 RepID=UPI00361F74D1